MNPITVTKCLIIQASSLLPEIQEIVKSYAFYHTSSDEFLHHQYFRPTLQRIQQSASRRNGFDGVRENDTTEEIWSFDTLGEMIYLHAMSCSICGNYVESDILFSHHYSWNLHIKCKCIRYTLSDSDDDYEEYRDYDY